MSNRFRIALLDLDGTLWRDGHVIHGAPAFVERLRTQGVQPVFFTNNASRTPQQVVDVLHKCEIEATPHEVCTSAEAAVDRLTQRVPTGSIVTFVGGQGLEEALLNEGFDARRAHGEELNEAWVNEAKGAIVGMDHRVTYLDLAVVSRVAYRLKWFILTNQDVRLPVEGGFLPGTGSLGALVRTASSAEQIVTGKPDAAFVDFALKKYGAKRSEAVIVGDNPWTDIQAGVNTGVYSILVQSGISEEVKDGDPKPDEVAKSVDDLFRQ